MAPEKTKAPTKETDRRAAKPSLGIISAFYDDPKNRAGFEEWLKKKEAKGAPAHA
jgi:hypothetical protein